MPAKTFAQKKRSPKGDLLLAINGCSPVTSYVCISAVSIYMNDTVNAPVSAQSIVGQVATLNAVLFVIRIRIVMLPPIVELEETNARAVARF